jgi:SAM-dependent methyltransferase
MLRFALPESLAHEPLSILDYGGGGGQFALVARSHFPQATVYITDINDHGLLDEWRPLNVQIPFGEFPRNSTRFDAIFLNDVFEHVADPVGVLRLLASKLKPDGRIFIDTPKVFWLYPVTRWLAPGLHAKLLKGTVSLNHLQIWSRRSFHHAVEKSGLRITKYAETSEYTMGADYYLSKRMGIQNSTVRCMGHLFFRVARWVAKNKIIAVLAH